MPLPNLSANRSVNTGSGQLNNSSNQGYDPASSYREKIREKIQSSPRRSASFRRSIDLNLSGEGGGNAKGNASDKMYSTSRHVIVYNKNFVPSKEDGVQQHSDSPSNFHEHSTVIQDDEDDLLFNDENRSSFNSNSRIGMFRGSEHDSSRLAQKSASGLHRNQTVNNGTRPLQSR
jgi:hypothetical protein